MPGEVLPKQPPIKPEKPQKRFEVIEGGKKEVKKVEKKDGGKTPPRRIGLKIGAGIGAGVLLGGGGAAAYYIQHEQAQSGDQITQDEQGNPVAVITAPETIVPETTAPPTTAEMEKVDAPEIKGDNFCFVFDQKAKRYIDEETGREVGLWIEQVVKVNGELKPAIALVPEALNKILEENAKSGVFKCPWPFDWRKEKSMEIEELIFTSLYKQEVYKRDGVYLPTFIGIKFSNPIDFFAPFDVGDGMGKMAEIFPKGEKDPEYFTNQQTKHIILGTAISYESKKTGEKSYASIQFNFIDWKPSVDLGESYALGDDGFGKDFTEEIKTGYLLGKILPNTSDIDFLDYMNNSGSFENHGEFQGRLLIFDFVDDFSKTTSSLEKMLFFKNKKGLDIPVCIQSEEKPAYEPKN